MSDFVLVGIFNTGNDLLEDLTGVFFRQLLAPGNEVEELTTGGILEYHEDLRLGVYELEKLDRMRIVESSENFELPFDFLEHAELTDFFLI